MSSGGLLSLRRNIAFLWSKFSQMTFVFRKVSTCTVNYHRSVIPGPERYSLWKVNVNKNVKNSSLTHSIITRAHCLRETITISQGTVVRMHNNSTGWWNGVCLQKTKKNTPLQIATAILKVIFFITFRTVNWVLKSQNSPHKSLFKQLKDWQVSKFLQIREEKQKKSTIQEKKNQPSG